MRRFSDFLGLHEKLTDKYARRGRIIPPAPEKSLVRRRHVLFVDIQISDRQNVDILITDCQHVYIQITNL
jgi:sorting nexin-1/2